MFYGSVHWLIKLKLNIRISDKGPHYVLYNREALIDSFIVRFPLNNEYPIKDNIWQSSTRELCIGLVSEDVETECSRQRLKVVIVVIYKSM